MAGKLKRARFVREVLKKKTVKELRVIRTEVFQNTSMCKGVIPGMLVMKQDHDGVRYRMRSWEV